MRVVDGAQTADGTTAVEAGVPSANGEASPTGSQVRAVVASADEISTAATSRRARRRLTAGEAVVRPIELLAEQAATPVAAPDGLPGDRAPAAAADAFALASEAFGFLPVDDDPAPTVAAEPTEKPTVHVVPRRPRRGRRIVAAGTSLGVMGVAALMAVSMTLPAGAVAAAQSADAPRTSLVAADTESTASEVDDDEIQAFVAPADVEDASVARSDSYSTLSLSDMAAEEGIDYSRSLYVNDQDAAIQWPFVVGVAMSSGYGFRNGRMHEGIDLVPGAGAPIQAIADGTVRIATESGGNYGVTAYIDHVIDGAVVTSHYSHMQYGSLQVQAGQKVAVGDIIGRVGNTGRSYGAHLHFEILVNGSTIDPLPWLRKNAGRYDGVTAAE